MSAGQRSNAFILERTQRPELEQLEGNVQRALEAVRARTSELTDNGYTPGDATDWAAPAPTTYDEAIDRLADAVRGLLAGPVP